MIEAVVAISIITIFIYGAMSLAQKSVRASRLSLHSTQATFLAEQAAEAVRILRDNSWTNNIANFTPGVVYHPYFNGTTWVLQTNQNLFPSSSIGSANLVNFDVAIDFETVKRVTGTPGTDDITTIANSYADPKSKLVKINVAWQEFGVTQNKELQFYIMDIFNN